MSSIYIPAYVFYLWTGPFYSVCYMLKKLYGTVLIIFFCLFNMDSLIRNEKNQLLLGIRRANRPQTVMPSSVLSSDSMHIGLLAAAAHAAATNSRFTIFYNPRWSICWILTDWKYSMQILIVPFTMIAGQALQNLSFPWLSMLKQSIILGFLWACDLGCCLRLKSRVFVGRSYL